MRPKTGLSIVLAMAAVLAGCATHRSGATLLNFTEQDQGGEPYATRMLVDRDYLRMDNAGDAGFVLLDRRAHTVYSVSPADRTILVIAPLPIALAQPQDMEPSVERDSARFPDIGGKRVTHYRLLTAGAPCSDVYAADGLLPEAVAALREYHQILAGEQAQTEMRMPASERSLCDLTDFVFAPARYLDHGFPVRQVSRNGHTRQLVDFKLDAVVADDWHGLPPDFRRYRISDMVPR